MDKMFLGFDDTEIEKHRFQQHKNLIWINNVDIDKILIYKKSLFWWKGF